MPNPLNPKGTEYRQLRKEGKFQCFTCLLIDTLDNKYRDRAMCLSCYKVWETNRKTHSSRHYESLELLKTNQFRCNICKNIVGLETKDKWQGCCYDCCLAGKRRRKHVRRAREKGAQGSYTREQLQSRLNYFGNICIYCKTSDNITVDHLIPLSRGGTNFASNLAPSCRRCNASKNSKTYKEFIKFKEKI